MLDLDRLDTPAPAPTTVGEFLASRPVAGDRVAAAKAGLVEYLAGRGGSAFEAECRRAGHGDDAMLAALTDDPEDKRRKAHAKVDRIGGDVVLWLTTPGWKAAGKPSRTERRPTTQTLAHADAPRVLRTWLEAKARSVGDAVTATLETDPALLGDLSEVAKARAWGRLQARTATDSDGGVGALTGGFHPDALVFERWWNPGTYRSAYGLEPDTHVTAEEVVELVYAVEVEQTTKSAQLLRAKVTRLDAARDLGAIQGTLWVVRSAQVARALAAFGIGAAEAVGANQRPGHYFVPAHALGLGGDLLPYAGPSWWPLRLTS